MSATGCRERPLHRRLGHTERTTETDRGQLARVHEAVHRHARHPHRVGDLGDGQEPRITQTGHGVSPQRPRSTAERLNDTWPPNAGPDRISAGASRDRRGGGAEPHGDPARARVSAGARARAGHLRASADSGSPVDGGRLDEGADPLRERLEARRLQPVVAVLPLLPHGHDLELAQRLQMLRDRRLAQAELGRRAGPRSPHRCRRAIPSARAAHAEARASSDRR